MRQRASDSVRNQEVLDTTHTQIAMKAEIAADAAGLSLVEEANGRSAWTFAKRPLARLILQGIKEKHELFLPYNNKEEMDLKQVK